LTNDTAMLSEEILEQLYSFEEPLENYLRKEFTALTFDAILLGGMFSLVESPPSKLLCVDIRFDELDINSFEPGFLETLRSKTEVFIEKKIMAQNILNKNEKLTLNERSN
jgi:hypothetical protein